MNNEELIHEIRKGNEAAKLGLIKKNLPLIHYFIKRYLRVMPYELTNEDLEQAGIIGLIKALDNFDFSYKVKFITFAYRYVRGEILKTMESCNTKSRPFSSYIKSLNCDDDQLLAEEVADYFKFNTSGGESFENNITDKIFAKEILEMLTEKQKEIMKYRYQDNLTQQETGKKMGLHQVDISREESKAKRKITLILESKKCSG